MAARNSREPRCDVIGKYVARASRWPGRTRWYSSHEETCSLAASPPRRPTACTWLRASHGVAVCADRGRRSPPSATGKMVVLVDDEDRENEGDLAIAAEHITPEVINFMATHGRGLVCLAMTAERLDALEIPLEVSSNTSRARRRCASPSTRAARRAPASRPPIARDRSRRRSRPTTRPQDLLRPGHVFPLRAARAACWCARADRGRRRSGAVAGLKPAGVICEIMSKDGTMARVPSWPSSPDATA